MLSETVDVVIGADTHVQTHTAAVVRAATEIEHRTQPANPDGYADLVVMADKHPKLRIWAIESTSRYGASLARRKAA